MTTVAGPPAAVVVRGPYPRGRSHCPCCAQRPSCRERCIQSHTLPASFLFSPWTPAKASGDTHLSRHANRVPIYSINGGPKTMIYLSKKEAERALETGEVRKKFRLKDTKPVMPRKGIAQ